MVNFFSIEQQGLYYTFSSIIAAQILFELGMTVVITHFASHLMVGLQWGKGGELSGTNGNLQKLGSLTKLTLRWFFLVSMIFMVTVGAFGWYFLSIATKTTSVNWSIPWILLVLFSSLNIINQPFLSLFEGCQLVQEIARVRLIQSVLSSLISIIFLILGTGLYALTAWSAANALIPLIYLVIYKRVFFRQMYNLIPAGLDNILWLADIWPMQWRIALSWVSGYFVYQLFVPVLLATRGPEEAGRLGMSMAIVHALMGLALAWFNTKIPIFGKLVALKDYKTLDAVWLSTAVNSLTVYSFGGICLIIIVYFLDFYNSKLASRMLDVDLLVFLICAAGSNYLMIMQASYLRSHKEEPFLWVSLTYGVLVTFSTFIFSKFYGVNGVVIGYFICSVLCGVFWSSFIFCRKRKEYRLRAKMVIDD
jgi:hypothetical protein